MTATRVACCASLAVNVFALTMALATSGYAAAGAQAVLVALLVACLWVCPKIDRYLDALLGQAVAQRRIAELAQHHVESCLREGTLRVGVTEAGIRVN